MNPHAYLVAARVPRSLKPQTFGLWTIERLAAGSISMDAELRDAHRKRVGFVDYTILFRQTLGNMMFATLGDVVMEDGVVELRKHLPIWVAARGRVLVTGLGLGCVVRGLLAKPEVEHVDVVELDAGIIRVVGAEFAGNPRVTIYHGDALTLDVPGRWDYAWHDLWVEDEHLQSLHAKLFVRFAGRARRQGAWAFPRFAARLITATSGFRPLGAPRYRSFEERTDEPTNPRTNRGRPRSREYETGATSGACA